MACEWNTGKDLLVWANGKDIRKERADSAWCLSHHQVIFFSSPAPFTPSVPRLGLCCKTCWRQSSSLSCGILSDLIICVMVSSRNYDLTFSSCVLSSPPQCSDTVVNTSRSWSGFTGWANWCFWKNLENLDWCKVTDVSASRGNMMMNERELQQLPDHLDTRSTMEHIAPLYHVWFRTCASLCGWMCELQSYEYCLPLPP